MISYAIRRILYLVPTLLGITLITFLVILLAPGDPVQRAQGGMIKSTWSRQAYEDMKRLYGLNKPLLVDSEALLDGRLGDAFDAQYWIWLKRFATMDFGESFADRRPVIDKIMEKLPATLQLNILSLLLSVGLAVPIGIYSAAHRDSAVDKFGGALLYMLYSLPNFWVAIMLANFFGVKLGILPFYGIESDHASALSFWPWLWDRIQHLVLPVICLTYLELAFLSRFARSSMLEVIQEDYVRTARAKGLAERTVIYRHALRNALIPILTLMAMMLPGLVGGAVIIEYIFAWPGIGRLYFDSVLGRDYPTIMGLSVISAFLVLAFTLLADLLYAIVDPRITYD